MKARDRLIESLETQIMYWYSLPGGVDEDADPEDPSPVDAAAHIAGLAVREAKLAIAVIRGELE